MKVRQISDSGSGGEKKGRFFDATSLNPYFPCFHPSSLHYAATSWRILNHEITKIPECRAVLFQMKYQLKLVPACPVFVCSNRLRVNFLPPRWSFGLGISGNLRNAHQSPMHSSASSAVQCRQGYRRRSPG